MSGGAFNYFYIADDVGDGWLNNIQDLRDMIDYCRRIDKPEIMAELIKLRDFLEETQNKVYETVTPYHHLLLAIEWEASGDYGMESVDKAFEDFKKKSLDI